MFKATKLANAAAIVAIVCQVLYIIVVAIAPGLLYWCMRSMVPGYDLSVLESSAGINYGMALVGLILMAVSVWVMVYVVAWLYNRFLMA